VKAETPAQRMAALEKAVRAALYGPEVKKLKVNGHEFNVKKAKITASATGTTITGQISHHLSFRPDDQLYYTIRKFKGKVVSVSIKIDRGGLAPYVAKFASKYLGIEFAQSQIESLLRELGAKIDGKWESAAELIVTAVAVKAPDMSGRTTPPPVGSVPYKPVSSVKVLPRK
jgi:hypothetical protein